MNAVAVEVIWDLLVFLTLFAAGLVVLAYWLARAEAVGVAHKELPSRRTSAWPHSMCPAYSAGLRGAVR
jgi:hypothetical protein